MDTLNKKTELSFLAPFDFTPLSVNSLRVATAMCLRHNGKLHIVHALENDYVAFPQPAHSGFGGNYSHFDSRIAIQKYLKGIKNHIEQTFKIKVQIHIKKGTPAEVICATGERVNASLIVMGTHGASGFREYFIGSNAYKVVKNALSPVLTVPGNYNKETFDSILFPVRNVFGVEEKYDSIRYIILKDKSQLEVVGMIDQKEPEPEERSQINKILDSLRLKFKNDDIPFFSLVYDCNNMAEKIIELTKTRNPDLLVINATMDFNWKEVFIGNYTQQIVNHAQVPVLSFKEEYRLADLVQNKIQVAEWAKKYSFADPLAPAFW